MSSATEESLTTSSQVAYGTDTKADEGEAGDNDHEAEETRKQVVFALSLLAANLVNAVALNLEAYVTRPTCTCTALRASAKRRHVWWAQRLRRAYSRR